MKIIFNIDDDFQIQSEQVEVKINDDAFDIPVKREKLKPLCKAIAKLRGQKIYRVFLQRYEVDK